MTWAGMSSNLMQVTNEMLLPFAGHQRGSANHFTFAMDGSFSSDAKRRTLILLDEV